MPTAALLLAGGMSTRMGTDKASLPFQGRRLVEVIADRLRALKGVDAVFVSGVIEGLPSIPDEQPARGPLEGVRSVISETIKRGEHFARFLIVPVDMPNLSSEHLENLLATPAGEAQAVHFSGFELPLLLTHSHEVMRQLSELCSDSIPANKRSFRQLLAGLESVAIPPNRPAAALARSFMNTNTPEEWERAIL